MIKNVETNDELASQIAESEYLLVRFGASWCGPCKMLDPVLEQVDSHGKADILKVDVEQVSEEAKARNVKGVPTMILYKDGEPYRRTTGYLPYGALLEQLGF